MRTTRERLHDMDQSIPPWITRLLFGVFVTGIATILTAFGRMAWNAKLDTNRFVVDSISVHTHEVTTNHIDSLLHEMVRQNRHP